MAELVPDIFEDILVRLDVKDLLRCKSVCKSWNSLITSPRFIKIHLKYSYNNDRNNNEIGHRRMVMSRHPNNCNFEVDVTFLYENETRKVIGSSNGLVCISDYDNHILVVNPSTREVNKVQKPSIPDSWTLCWGFGYDSSTYDYKVIVGFRKGSNLTCFQVLSLKSNEWKVIGDVNYSFTNRNIAVFCNGALHWAMHHDAKPYIICFDLSNEELKEIPQPDNSLYKPTRHCYMGIIEECLCLFRLVSFPYDIWVMKNYNLMESWERMPYDYKWKPEVAHNFKELRIYIPHFKPLCHGDLLLCRGPGFIFAPMFVQSLVTLHVNGKPNKKRQAKNDRMSCKLIKGDPSASEPSAEALLIMLKYSR